MGVILFSIFALLLVVTFPTFHDVCFELNDALYNFSGSTSYELLSSMTVADSNVAHNDTEGIGLGAVLTIVESCLGPKMDLSVSQS